MNKRKNGSNGVKKITLKKKRMKNKMKVLQGGSEQNERVTLKNLVNKLEEDVEQLEKDVQHFENKMSDRQADATTKMGAWAEQHLDAISSFNKSEINQMYNSGGEISKIEMMADVAKSVAESAKVELNDAKMKLIDTKRALDIARTKLKKKISNNELDNGGNVLEPSSLTTLTSSDSNLSAELYQQVPKITISEPIQSGHCITASDGSTTCTYTFNIRQHPRKVLLPSRGQKKSKKVKKSQKK